MKPRGYACIGLHEPKTTANIAGVLRAAGCYEVAMVAVSGHRYRHGSEDTQKAWRHLPFVEVASLEKIVPFSCMPVAVELLPDAKDLRTFTHPERAFYVFGGEDRTLGEDVLKWCEQRVFVPTRHCMNLAAAVNVVLYDRLAKSK